MTVVWLKKTIKGIPKDISCCLSNNSIAFWNCKWNNLTGGSRRVFPPRVWMTVPSFYGRRQLTRQDMSSLFIGYKVFFWPWAFVIQSPAGNLTQIIKHLWILWMNQERQASKVSCLSAEYIQTSETQINAGRVCISISNLLTTLSCLSIALIWES